MWEKFFLLRRHVALFVKTDRRIFSAGGLLNLSDCWLGQQSDKFRCRWRKMGRQAGSHLPGNISFVIYPIVSWPWDLGVGRPGHT